jgi:AraC family transcriptional regulator, regulatory protein of adaptative response / methylated-DNA-[protein]-cysteine methyltransferase
MLDVQERERARVSWNRAYDGRFFTGVRTTGIYCRPVCPVRPARAENVEFFATAAAAEVAGYRPCLRCRPEAVQLLSNAIGG